MIDLLRYNALSCLFICLSCLFGNPANAQVDDRTTALRYQNLKETYTEYTGKSYLTLKLFNSFRYLNQNALEKNISQILVGDINPHFYLLNKNKIPQSGELLSKQNKFLNRLYIDINPRLYLRLLSNQESAPARTPSAIPSILLNWLWYPNHSQKQFSFYIGYLHHSNGQDGKAFSSEAFSNNDIPPQKAFLLTDRTFNIYNGNFSTNIFPLGMKVFYITEVVPKIVKPDPEMETITRNEIFFDFRLEPHSKVFGIDDENIVFGYEPALLGYYSFMDFVFNFQNLRLAEYQNNHSNFKPENPNRQHELDRLNFEMRLRLGKLDRFSNSDRFSRRFDLNLTYSRRIFRSNQTAWYIRAAYVGSDFYNIYLEDQYFTFQLGLSTGNFRFIE